MSAKKRKKKTHWVLTEYIESVDQFEEHNLNNSLQFMNMECLSVYVGLLKNF